MQTEESLSIRCFQIDQQLKGQWISDPLACVRQQVTLAFNHIFANNIFFFVTQYVRKGGISSKTLAHTLDSKILKAGSETLDFKR